MEFIQKNYHNIEQEFCKKWRALYQGQDLREITAFNLGIWNQLHDRLARACWRKSFWRRLPQPPPSPENWIKDLLSMAPTWTLCTRTQEKGTVTPQETCLWVFRNLQQSRGLVVACCRVGGIDYSSTCLGSFEGGHHYLHYLHHSLRKWSRSVVSDSLWPHGYQAPLSMGGKHTGVGCHFLLQGIFPTQGLNSGLLHCKQTFYHLSHQWSPNLECTTSP